MKTLLVLGCAVLLSACDLVGLYPDLGVRFNTEQAVYAPGEAVLLRLVNESERPVLVNFCELHLERRNDAWERIAPNPCQVPAFSPLEPGGEIVYGNHFTEARSPGWYRFRMVVRVPEEGTDAYRTEEITTNVFSVRASGR